MNGSQPMQPGPALGYHQKISMAWLTMRSREEDYEEFSNFEAREYMAGVASWASTLPKQLAVIASNDAARAAAMPASTMKACSGEITISEKGCFKRRLILVGAGTLTTKLLPASLASAEEVPKNYQAFVDFSDGYSYYYPSDWREFDYTGHDSAFKDRFAALQHVRVSFIPTDKSDVHELGPMQEVVFNLVKNVYAAPIQKPTIYDMQERTLDGRNYWTFEYELTSPSFSRTAFATIAIGNGRYYTLVVGANERRWSRVRSRLKVVADSFRILDT